MDQLGTQLLSSCLQFPANLVIIDVQMTAARVSIQMTCDSPTVRCPLCQQLADRVHGQYRRTVADVPCGGVKSQ